MPATATGRGAQVILDGDAQKAARGAYAPTYGGNAAYLDLLERTGVVADSDAAPDGVTKTGAPAADYLIGKGGYAGTKQYVDALASPMVTALYCGCPLADGVNTDSTSNSMNVRRGVMAPTSCDVSDIVVAIPGSYFSANETTIPTAFTVAAASVEYPAGTFYQLFANGSATLAIVPGRTMARFDPCPITVTAGDKFWVKLFLQWTPGSMKLQNRTEWEIIGNWTNAGTGLTDQTRTTTVLTSGDKQHLYGNLMVYGRCATQQPCIGFLGDSIMSNGLDMAEPDTNAIALVKALRNIIPSANISEGGDSCLGYLTRHECRDMYLRDPTSGRVYITDLFITFGRNEISSAATLQSNITKATKLWLGRGVRVYGWTITPQTTSSDNWATAANQTVTDASAEAQRLLYNAWLRANYRTIGMTRIIDAARIVDPTDSGKWNVDGASGYWGFLIATMNGRSIGSAIRPDYNGGQFAAGGFYPANQTVNCAIYPMPGDTGRGGGAVSVTFNGAGWVPATGTVITGGDYDYPPMIVVPGAWTGDGLHPATRAFQEIIYRSGLSPAWFGA